MRWRFARHPICLLCAFALPALGQNQPGTSPSQASIALDSNFTTASGYRISGLPVEAFRKNQPLSLSLTTTGVQTLADGTKITQTSHSRLYRDGAGRLRMESYYESGQMMGIFLMDPLAGKITMLRVVGKTANTVDYEGARMMKALAARTTGAGATPPRGETDEPLPARTLLGYAADGTRRSRTIPAGTPSIGNDKPLHIVTEEWFSPQLGVDLQYTTSDPRTGETTMTASDIQLKEQDPALFQVPADYKLVTQ